MATTASSSLVFEDNVGEDGLSSQLTYKVNIDLLYYKAPIAPNLSWGCWRHVGDMSPTCQNVANFFPKCVSVPTPKLP
jgi:hypothetical protein